MGITNSGSISFESFSYQKDQFSVYLKISPYFPFNISWYFKEFMTVLHSKVGPD